MADGLLIKGKGFREGFTPIAGNFDAAREGFARFLEIASEIDIVEADLVSDPLFEEGDVECCGLRGEALLGTEISSTAVLLLECRQDSGGIRRALEGARSTKAGAIACMKFCALFVEQRRQPSGSDAPTDMRAEVIIMVIAHATGQIDRACELALQFAEDAGVVAVLFERVSLCSYMSVVGADNKYLPGRDIDSGNQTALLPLTVEAGSECEWQTIIEILAPYGSRQRPALCLWRAL